MRTHTHGFTLIELMVVISIIGLLASVIISSLNVARQKGRDGAIKQQIGQLRTLIELNYSEYGTYSQIQPYIWFQNPIDCSNSITTGNYANQAQLICLNLFKLNGNSPNNWLGPSYFLFLGNNVSNSNKYSISTFLPGKGKFYCLGSGGISSDTTGSSDTWINPGCMNNP
ncbi:MAG: prepilin peptidase dependent protein type pilus assembly protein PilA [Parcubacteria group bacterium]|nr:prepilin peptidase dependent protein type pilus assembly protein PilA [Parcubacteria group bacterium]